jgi:photosystem II stability/assembly factor-like uncharacterized protein
MKKNYFLFVGFILSLNVQSQITQFNDPLMYGGEINGYAVNSGCAMITTNGGIFKTTDGGQTWANVSQNISTISNSFDKIETLGNDFYALNNNNNGNSIYKSTDNGTTWIPLSFSSFSWYPQALGKLGNSLYVVGVNNMNGLGQLYSSTDGNTWTTGATIFTNGWQGGNLELLSFNQDKIYLIYQNSLYYTTDGNTMNVVSLTGLGDINIGDNNKSIQGDATGNLYFRNDNGSGNAVYKYNFSTDNWADISTGQVAIDYQVMGFSATDNALFLVAMNSIAGMLIYKSTDQGASFSVITNPGITLPMLSNIKGISANGFIANGLYDELEVSMDGGNTWNHYSNQFIASYAGSLIHSVNTLLYPVQTRGIILSSDQGTTWNVANNGIPGFSGVAFFVNQIEMVKDTLFSFLQPNPFSDQIVLYKSSNSGASWAPSPLPSPYNVKGTDYTFAGKCDTALFVNYYDSITSQYALIVTYNNGASWLKPGSQNSDQLTFLKGPKKCLFAFNAYPNDWSDFNNVYKANSYGMSFTNLNPNFLFNSSFTIKRTQDSQGDKAGPIMDVDASNTYALFAVDDQTMGNSLNRLYMFTINTGTWSEVITSGLPENYMANCIKNTGNNKWLMATSVGLYKSSDGGANWTIAHNANAWLEGMTVKSIQLINNNNINVFLGTLANGVWEVNITTGLIAPLSVNDISVFPDPCVDLVQVTIPDLTVTTAQVSLYNLAGKELIHKTVSNNIFSVDLHSLASGNYILLVNSNNQTYRKSIIKQ